MADAWIEQTVHVRRIENVMLEVRQLSDKFSWRVIDGHYDSRTGDLIGGGNTESLQEAQGECMDLAIDHLDQVSPR